MNLAVITSSRSEYDLLSNILLKLEDDADVKLDVIASGAHVSNEFGYTVDAIRKHHYKNIYEIDILQSGNDRKTMAKSIAKGIELFSEKLSELKPDALLLLGDRFETFAAATSAKTIGVPIIHFSGGDTTEGAIDNEYRHAISLMSNLHFVKLLEHQEKLKSFGLPSEEIHIIGSLSIENSLNYKKMSLKEINQKFNISIKSPFSLVTFHPVTAASDSIENDIDVFLSALKDLSALDHLITAANEDFGGEAFNLAIRKFEAENEHVSFVESLSKDAYFSLMSCAKVMIGNTSSGLLESGNFKLPVVNITPRQNGRMRNVNVLDVQNIKEEIIEAVKKATSNNFKNECDKMKNIFEVIDPTTISDHVVKIIKQKF